MALSTTTPKRSKCQRFTLTISLGDDAMQTGADIARALRDVADHVDGAVGYHLHQKGDAGKIIDENGNSVGTWEVR